LIERLIDVPIYYRGPEDLRANSRWRWLISTRPLASSGWSHDPMQFVPNTASFGSVRLEHLLVKNLSLAKLFQVPCEGLSNLEIFARLISAFRQIQDEGFLASF
jgi:hypothetical protein